MPLLFPIDADAPAPTLIARAAAVLRAGGLIGLPTETVYGLAANALDPTAVARIFAAKGRPADNPLICHIADPADVAGLAAAVPAVAVRLMLRFWPGPLTLIFPARAEVPAGVTAGTGRVAVRLPAHAVARAVIAAAGCPLAAPSANRSGRPSPTTARHVLDDLGDAVALILDAGPSPVGVESTVLDISGERPVLARAGGVPVEIIEALIGPVERRTRVGDHEPPVSPGQKYRHYAPVAPVHLAVGSTAERRAKLGVAIEANQAAGRRVAVLCLAETAPTLGPVDLLFILGPEAGPEVVARSLFRLLRAADASGADIILAESIPEAGVGAAANDRLRRAATKLL